ncbi:MAG: DUF370 domain-containing protein [Oscillospiraceae bacterium]|nr:DUF370 domain-containing protein [Oscillospiraceae bacterium]
MYLHLGQNVVVFEDDIIGIFDMDNTTSSHITRKFLSNAEKTGKVINVSTEIPNSFIITCRKEKGESRVLKGSRENETKSYSENIRNRENREIVYISPLSSQTLLRRAESSVL